MAPPNAQREFLVTVSGIEGYWARKEGGATTADATKAWDGGSLRPSVLTAPAETDDVTLTRPFRVERDAAVVARLKRIVGRSAHTITVVPTDRDLVPAGPPEVYTGVLRSVTGPPVDASSGDASTVELVFAIEDAS